MFDLPNIANIFTKIFGVHYACSLLFGELDVPMEEE